MNDDQVRKVVQIVDFLARQEKSKRPVDREKLIAVLRFELEQVVGNLANQKNPAAVALGRCGGLAGGIARARHLSAEKRSEIARNAAKKRWSQ